MSPTSAKQRKETTHTTSSKASYRKQKIERAASHDRRIESLKRDIERAKDDLKRERERAKKK